MNMNVFFKKHFTPGRQEDAHEFMCYLLDAMDKSYSSRSPNNSKEITSIKAIFGGTLGTTVCCSACGHKSMTTQCFDCSPLDIQNSMTLEQALDSYFDQERLENLSYRCESCKEKVLATKQSSIESPPTTLCILLKRFSVCGNKLMNHIGIPAHLNLSKYSSQQNATLQYRLVSAITHYGASQHCGHYTSISLTNTSVPNDLQTNGYILFYELNASTY